MIIFLIAAMGQGRVIGYQNKMPWHIPEELQYFRRVTLNHVVVMGRKTYGSIGKPLDHRVNVVLTQDRSFQAPEGVRVYHSVEDFLSDPCWQGMRVFVIGGQAIYEAFLPYAHFLHLTRIDECFKGDRYFPLWEPEEWESLGQTQRFYSKAKNLPYYHIAYQRQNYVYYSKALSKRVCTLVPERD